MINSSKPYRILIVAPSWVGDMVMSQTLFKLLKKQYGDNCQIDVLVNEWALGIVARMPEVNNVLVNPFAHGEFALLKRIKLGWSLRKNHYDHVYVLPNSLKSALVPFFAGVKRRTGFVGEMRYGLLNEVFKLDKVALPKMIDRFCALANHGLRPHQIDSPSFVIDKNNQQNILSKFSLDLDLPVICLCPAAEYGQAKRWPTVHFAKLADMLQDAGYQVWIVGSAKDQSVANEIIAHATNLKRLVNLCGKTNLVDVVDLLACATAVVSNDSGLMHIACAIKNLNVFAIYGSSSPVFTPPLSETARIIKIDIDCAPCFARTCQFGHYNCLYHVTPQMLFSRLIKCPK